MTGYVVQAVQGTSFVGATTGTVTLGSTTAGNTLIAVASISGSVSNGSLSSVTLGGLADNFTQIQSFGTTGGSGRLFWWLDPLCAGGQTTVVFTEAGGSGGQGINMTVLEVGGLFPVTSYDASTSGTSASSASWNTGTARTGWPTEIIVAAAVAPSHITSTSGYPWVQLAVLENEGSGAFRQSLVGYQLTPSIQNASWAGTTFGTTNTVAGFVSIPAITTSPSLPTLLTGEGYQQGDALTMITEPLAFVQQLVMFRGAQTTTTTTLPAGNPGAQTTIGIDTVYEDPFQGFSTSTHLWTVPFSGWYRISRCVSTGAAPANSELNIESNALVLPTTGGILQITDYSFGVGGQTTFSCFANLHNSASNVVTSNSPPSTLEISWMGFTAS